MLCLQYAKNDRIYCHGPGLIIKLQGPTRIHHSKNSETAIQWCCLNFDHALKSHCNVKVRINYTLFFCQHNWSLQYYLICLMDTNNTNNTGRDKYEVN